MSAPLHYRARCSVRKDVTGPLPTANLDNIESGSGRLTGDLPRTEGAGACAFAPNDVIFGKLRPYLGKSYLVTEPMYGSSEFLCLTPGPELDSRYLKYVTMSRRWLDWAEASSYGSKMPRTSWEAMRSFSMDWPGIGEQRRIADFLDDQVTFLERTVTTRRRLLDLLDERVNTLVGAHVIRLLDSADGTGALPIKRLLRKHARPPGQGTETVTAFRDGQVIARGLRRAEGYTEAVSDAAAMQGVVAGDIVIHGLDGFSGAVGTSVSTGRCSPTYHVCTPQGSGDADFYGRLLRMLALGGYLSLYGGSARERAVDFRNWATFARTPLPIVAPQRQREIGDAIRSIRPLREAVNVHAGLVAEKKQTLITVAVAGEIDITTAGRVAR